MKKYDWHLIIPLSLPGPIMGVLTLYGIIPFSVGRWIWAAVSIVVAVTIAHRVERDAFRHGAVVGFLVGASLVLIQAIWADVYLANNPELAQMLTGPTAGPAFQYRRLMLVPFVGILTGGLVGRMSHFTHEAMQRHRREEAG